MASPPVTTALPARPSLSLVPRDDMQALVNQIERVLDEPHGEMVEFPDPSRYHCPTLFRYILPDGRMAYFSVNPELLDSDVRAAWWALARLIESKAVV